MNLRGFDFVIISSIDWDFLWQRHQTFASGLAQRGARVFFIENTGFRNIKLSDLNRILLRVKNILLGVTPKRINPISKNIEIISPLVLPPVGSLNVLLNRHFFVPYLIKKIKKRNLKKNLVIITYLPTITSIEIIKRLEPALVIYDCVANFESHPDVPKNYKSIERELLRLSDLILTDSDFLYEKIKRMHSRVEQIHHGVDFNLFRKADNEIIDKKKICYFGAISQHIDWKIIKNIAEAGYKVFLYGANLIQQSSANNIFIEGPFSQEILIDKIKDCAAIILPYKTDTNWMKGVIPAKIYECLATGMPILSTPLENYSDKIKKVIYLCNTPEEFIKTLENLDNLETQRKREVRINIARRQYREVNFNKLIDIITHEFFKKEI